MEKESNEVIEQVILEEESAIEDEVQEAQPRSVDSIEDRMKQFRELLAEKDVSIDTSNFLITKLRLISVYTMEAYL